MITFDQPIPFIVTHQIILFPLMIHCKKDHHLFQLTTHVSSRIGHDMSSHWLKTHANPFVSGFHPGYIAYYTLHKTALHEHGDLYSIPLLYINVNHGRTVMDNNSFSWKVVNAN